MIAPLAPVSRIRLEGEVVLLEPLRADHVAGLAAVGLDPGLWAWVPTIVRTEEEMAGYVADALHAEEAGTALPFAILERGSGAIVGSTRYGNIDRANGRLEIGWTWVAAPWQRTAVNTEAKYLLLRHAFGTLGARRVELKTDARNARSRAAILRLGATEEGTLRAHTVTWDDRARDTVYYSILRDEWPGIRRTLERRLGRISQ